MNDNPHRPLEHVTTTRQDVVRHLPLAELIEGARARQNAHIGQLMRLYADGLRQKLSGFSDDVCDDVVTDTFLALPEKLAGYVEDGRFEQWLFGVAFNIARTKRRSVKRREQHFVDTTAEGARMPSAVWRIEEEQLVAQAAEVLSPAEREVWFLTYRGFTAAEISALLRLKESAVHVRLHRARTRLAGAIDREP